LFVYTLEIELKNKETLSTLLYRYQSSPPSVDEFLDDLMLSDSKENQKAMQWNRKKLKETAASVYFLVHPDKKLLNEKE
jgi:hypothetical protein